MRSKTFFFRERKEGCCSHTGTFSLVEKTQTGIWVPSVLLYAQSVSNVQKGSRTALQHSLPLPCGDEFFSLQQMYCWWILQTTLYYCEIHLCVKKTEIKWNRQTFIWKQKLELEGRCVSACTAACMCTMCHCWTGHSWMPVKVMIHLHKRINT